MSQAGPPPPSPAIWLCGSLGPVVFFLYFIPLGAKVISWEIPHRVRISAFSLEGRAPILGLRPRMAVAWQ